LLQSPQRRTMCGSQPICRHLYEAAYIGYTGHCGASPGPKITEKRYWQLGRGPPGAEVERRRRENRGSVGAEGRGGVWAPQWGKGAPPQKKILFCIPSGEFGCLLGAIFTARLHIMQRMVLLSQFCLFVCLSVCISGAFIVTKVNDALRVF